MNESLPSLQAEADNRASDRCTEVCQVVAIAEMVGGDMRAYRIEIIRKYWKPGIFTSRVYRSDEGQWRQFNAPWVDAPSIDSAMAQTIGFLRRPSLAN